jgi:hypothetical protein
MKTFLVQVTQYGFTQIEAKDWDEAEKIAQDIPIKEFDMSKDVDVDVLDEIDNSDFDRK